MVVVEVEEEPIPVVRLSEGQIGLNGEEGEAVDHFPLCLHIKGEAVRVDANADGGARREEGGHAMEGIALDC